MNNPLLVCRFERIDNLTRDRQGLLERQCPCRESFGQGLTFDELQHQRDSGRRAEPAVGTVSSIP